MQQGRLPPLSSSKTLQNEPPQLSFASLHLAAEEWRAHPQRWKAIFMTQPICIVWFRKDLRIKDNPALHHAEKNGFKILPVVIFDPNGEGKWKSGAAHLAWFHHSLTALNGDLQKLGTQLIIRTGKSLECLTELITETGAKAVYWNRRYEPCIVARDAHIKQTLKHNGIATQTFNASLLAEPWDIQNKSGRPFQVFTPFWNHHRNCTSSETPLPAPSSTAFLRKSEIRSVDLDSLKLLPAPAWDKGFWDRFTPGEAGANRALNNFIKEGNLSTYENDRNRPDLTHTSRLSPHIHFGEISPRQIGFKIQLDPSAENKSASLFMSEIGWREFAHHLIYHFPHTTEHPLKAKFETFPWERNSHHLENWKRGRTGIPIVDAGMRELWHTGWMHNRVRMIVGSYLVKNLLIPWQEGAQWFWDTLIDADLASNTLGWQWVAGSGADAAPYFRIFNPILQSQKFDPNGDYIRTWVTELSTIDSKLIHTPWRSPEILKSTGYPEMRISLIESRNRALEAYERMQTSHL